MWIGIILTAAIVSLGSLLFILAKWGSKFMTRRYMRKFRESLNDQSKLELTISHAQYQEPPLEQSAPVRVKRQKKKIVASVSDRECASVQSVGPRSGEIPPSEISLLSEQLSSAYADIILAIESPLPITTYAREVADGTYDSSLFNVILSTAIFLSILNVCGPITTFRSPVLNSVAYLSLIVTFFFLLCFKFTRRIIPALFSRLTTVDYVVKVMAHNHIRSQLNRLARLYRARALRLTLSSPKRHFLAANADAYDQMAQELLSVKNIVYLSAPPVVVLILSRLDWGRALSFAPYWLPLMLGLYACQVCCFCFSAKRELFTGNAKCYCVNPTEQVYLLENRLYKTLDVRKKLEWPLDLLLFSAIALIMIGGAVFVLLLDGTSSVYQFFTNLNLDSFFGFIWAPAAFVMAVWMLIGEWRSRIIAGLA